MHWTVLRAWKFSRLRGWIDLALPAKLAVDVFGPLQELHETLNWAGDRSRRRASVAPPAGCGRFVRPRVGNSRRDERGRRGMAGRGGAGSLSRPDAAFVTWLKSGIPDPVGTSGKARGQSFRSVVVSFRFGVAGLSNSSGRGRVEVRHIRTVEGWTLMRPHEVEKPPVWGVAGQVRATRQ